jgi:hypothetical protein
MIENYRNLGGVTACINDWPFESAAPNKSTVSRLISRFKLTGSVFFLWGVIKDNVYKKKARNLMQLQQNICIPGSTICIYLLQCGTRVPTPTRVFLAHP